MNCAAKVILNMMWDILRSSLCPKQYMGMDGDLWLLRSTVVEGMTGKSKGSTKILKRGTTPPIRDFLEKLLFLKNI